MYEIRKTVYFFSGLGADERVFQFVDLSFCNPIFIKWNLPFENESIELYAFRLLEQIKEANPILVGVSFGGMIAVEVSKLIKTGKIILISSAKTKHEIPFYFKAAGKIHAHKIIPTSFLQNFVSINNFLFGVKTKEEKALLKTIIQETNPQFLKWAMEKIVHWQNEFIPNNILHIHGSKDKILLSKFVKADIMIENGTHFMIVQQSLEIGKIIEVNL